MDMKTRADLVRACRFELKRARRRARNAGLASARATEMTERGYDRPRPPNIVYPPRQHDTAPEPGSSDGPTEATRRRRARELRGVAVGGNPLTRQRRGLPDHNRPIYSTEFQSVTPRPGRDVGRRIRQRVARDARARPEVINHGLTPAEILAREGRINRAARRQQRQLRRLGRSLPHMALQASRAHERGGRH